MSHVANLEVLPTKCKNRNPEVLESTGLVHAVSSEGQGASKPLLRWSSSFRSVTQLERRLECNGCGTLLFFRRSSRPGMCNRRPAGRSTKWAESPSWGEILRGKETKKQRG